MFFFCWSRNTEALKQMAVGPVREGDASESHAEVRPRTHHTPRTTGDTEPGAWVDPCVQSPEPTRNHREWRLNWFRL